MSACKIGSRIRKFREARDMSVEQLAEVSGLAAEFIKTLEEESVYPTIGPLQKIAHALQVRLGTFMDDVHSKDPIIVTQKERQPDLIMHHSLGRQTLYRYYSLGKGKTDRNMEPFFIEVMPEPEDEIKLSTHQGEEFIIVHKGKLLVIYGNERSILEPGDTVYYNSIVPHYVGAFGEEPCSIYATFYHPA
ncbi:MAG: cupin domain-containing protein [Deltaproteobacteria bacterium]|jgi:transcriptional regulator with XRE-family HTH domain|nr:cupin domain-containing protein [Deltaproteobacteria bacterium]